MKIAVWHNLPSGGGKRALFQHVKGLVERGHQVEIWAPDTADHDYLPLSPFGRQHILPLADRINRYGMRHPRRKILQIKEMQQHCRDCAREIAGAGFDLVFANSCRYLYTSYLGLFTELPSALYLGEPFRRLYEAMPTLPWAALPATPLGILNPLHLLARIENNILLHNYRIQAREEYRAAAAYDRILVNSLFSRETIARIYNLDAKICYLGVDTECFAPNGPKEGYVVSVGHLQPGKGPDRVIEAVAAIPERLRPPVVWIANKTETITLTAINSLARTKKVDFTVRQGVSDQDLISTLARAAVMLYLPRLEPFGLAPLEANACGTGVVGIAEGGLRESITHGVNGYLTLDNDPVALAELVQRFISDLSRATDFGGQAREHVIRQWNLDQAIDILEKNLHSVASAHCFQDFSS